MTNSTLNGDGYIDLDKWEGDQAKEMATENQRIKEKAVQGDADAQYWHSVHLWLMYPSDIPMDKVEGLKYLISAAEQGHPLAQMDLSNKLMHGSKWVKRDRKRALFWLRKANAEKKANPLNLRPQKFNDWRAVNPRTRKHNKNRVITGYKPKTRAPRKPPTVWARVKRIVFNLFIKQED